MKGETVEISLTRGAFNILTHILSEPGWCTDVQHMYVTGKFLTELPEQPVPPADKAAQKAFVDEPLKVDLGEKQFEIFRLCVQNSVKRGILGVNVHTFNLIQAFNLGG